MRVQIFALVVALSLGMGICRAQSAESKPVEPVAVGQIFLLDSSSQTLKMLPVEGTKEVTHALGGGWSPYYLAGLEIKGTSSPFRIGSGTKIELVFKTGKCGVVFHGASQEEPESILCKKQGERTCIANSWNPYFGYTIWSIVVQVDDKCSSPTRRVPNLARNKCQHHYLWSRSIEDVLSLGTLLVSH